MSPAALTAAALAALAAAAPAPAAASGGALGNALGGALGGGRAAAPAGMVRLPAGAYRPLYARPGDGPVRVGAFALDREPATAGEYLDFVRAHPEWRRSRVRPVFAERGYLADWRGDLEPGGPGDAAALRRPVTGVSWFAARAYCAARGKRLPTVDEWEYAAAASETRRDAAREPGFVARLLGLYFRRAARALPAVGGGFRNAYGVRDLHELTWEWTLDFNGVLVSDDSREAGSGVAARDHDLFCAGAAIGAAEPGNYPAFMRYALRAGLTGRSTVRTLGVRCAADLAA